MEEASGLSTRSSQTAMEISELGLSTRVESELQCIEVDKPNTGK